MNPTVAEILQYEPFRRADARVVAGEQQLDRSVRWVHISEMPTPGRLFRGNELLLTQGRGISDDPARQRRWVHDLVEARIAGVAVELGVVLTELPTELVREAQSAGLPLVSLRHPAYFMDMTETVHATIINRQYGLLQRAERIGREFTRLVVQGAAAGRLITELASLVRKPVVLEDQAHQVTEYAPGTPELVDWLRDWQTHARTGHVQAPEGAPTHCVAGDTGCTWLPLIVRGEQWGTIHVLEQDGPCDEIDVLALDRAGAAIGLMLAVTADMEQQQADARSALVHDLVRGHAVDLREARRRAAGFGIDLDQSLRVIVLRPITASDERDTQNARVLRMAGAAARHVTTKREHQPLVGYDGNQVVVISPDRYTSRKRWQAVVDECTGLRDPVTVVVGVSEPVDLTGVSGAFIDAEDAVRHGFRAGQLPGVHLADELGINRLLLALDDSSALARHIERELGAVLDHDVSASAPLLPTLVAYLEAGGHKTAVARELNIERRTLYHRLARLNELVRGPLERPENQAALLLAVRGLQYRDQRPTADRALSRGR